ncbi:MFS transporter [Sphingomonas spermidinifaciens]|uniref:MFS transporter n=1 Tax=Sphingomonas spermidinifaciens TaxID=1141889 RepID=A0A2A4B7B1_9SPHN|nr:BCD family MFS transporter [Sphingomonas spermidinifaciens]PCD03648.1 MFS transporter [Sphingomonas spermidinifaciens]
MPLGWPGLLRLGLVQSAIGALAVLATSLLNRVMIVEYALPAALPAGLVAWHYSVQLSRPAWGHGSDRARRRAPWIVGGMAVLAAGTLTAVAALPLIAAGGWTGLCIALLAFTLIGTGVGAAGTTTLALLAAGATPAQRPAAAAIAWIMMILGIAVTAGVVGALIDPFSPARLLRIAAWVAMGAVALSIIATWRIEGAAVPPETAPPPLAAALRAIGDDPAARRFTAFVFVSMLAYSMQDLILEPFAGLRFGMSAGQSTSLTGVQHGGVLIGMIGAGIGGSLQGGAGLRRWITGGCAASTLAMVALALGAQAGPGWPLVANVALLGIANGIFAVAAIGAMMSLASAGGAGSEGVRMGVWGAAQAIAFALGGLLGAGGVDLLRAATGSSADAFAAVFAVEAALFAAAALLAWHPVSAPMHKAAPA